MKTYTFHVSLPGTGRVWRKIEMRADQTLEELHCIAYLRMLRRGESP
ncbi:MAG: hypothetical protein SWK90_06890 [Chloroflexota bacterium]|nr:hypothetical protein [Chloroflexota bacterium]